MPHHRLLTLAFAACLMGLLGLVVLPAQAQQWELVWQDEFDDDGLPDAAKWDYDVGGGGWGNNELQYYTEAREENARVEDGRLIIEARQESYGGREYTSARLVTRNQGDWEYGRIEVSAKLPSGRGTWPAIWMLPTEWRYGGWPASGEIDIMEYVGYDPGIVHGTVHTEAYNHSLGTQVGRSRTVEDAETAFHEYAIAWTPEKIDFFVDDARYFTFRNEHRGWEVWPFDQPFHLLLNIAVGGNWGGVQGVDPDIWPQRMEVDYVRVYENTAVPTVTLTDVPTDPLEPGTSLTLAAEAEAPAGTVQRVSFYQGDGLLGTVEEAPYAVTVDDLYPGCYVLTAEVDDGSGWIVRSEPDTVQVGEACRQAPYLMTPTRLPGTVEAEYFDVGGSGVGYGDLSADNTGGAIRNDEGVDIQATSEPGGYSVGWISRREWMAYTVEVEQAGYYTLEARVASQSTGGAFSLALDGEDITETIRFDGTGGWSSWATVTADSIMLQEGVHTLRIDMRASDFNLDRLTFARVTSSAEDGFSEPERLHLSSAPNPFVGTATVHVSLPQPGAVRVEVYDVQGRRVAVLLDGHRAAGTHRLALDGGALATGTYFVRLVTNAGQRVLPVTLLR